MTDQTMLFPEPILSDPAAGIPRATCRGCGAAMVWVASTKGGKVPLDPRPVPDGNLVFESANGLGEPSKAGEPTVRYLRKGDVVPSGTAKYKSHFATCPEAGQFRRTA
jgi:hypothetical protein